MITNAQEVEKLKTTAVQLLLKSMPEVTWTGILLRYQELDIHSQLTTFYIDEKKQAHAFIPTRDLLRVLHALRHVMHDSRKGTWWSLSFIVAKAPRKIAWSFNYDEEPYWETSYITFEDYKKDLRRYPRPKGLIPRFILNPDNADALQSKNKSEDGQPSR